MTAHVDVSVALFWGAFAALGVLVAFAVAWLFGNHTRLFR